MDIHTLASVFGIAAAAGGLILSAINYIRYLEGRLDSIRSQVKLQVTQTDGALQLLDHRVRELEKFSEKNSDFQVRYPRGDRTGAPFLED